LVRRRIVQQPWSRLILCDMVSTITPVQVVAFDLVHRIQGHNANNQSISPIIIMEVLSICLIETTSEFLVADFESHRGKHPVQRWTLPVGS
jgi:hypothetical protein